MKPEKLSELYDRYSQNIYRLALSFTGSVADAEDILQDVFFKLIEKNPVITKGREKSYLLTMTANMSRNHLKSASVRLKAELDEAREPFPADMTGEEVWMYEIIRNLPETYRTVIYLYYYEGYSYKEIAKILHLSASAVAMRISRAKDKIRAEFEE